MRYIKHHFLICLVVFSIFSCNRKENEKSNNETNNNTDSIEAGKLQNETNLPIKEIMSLAQKHFSTYQMNLLSDDTNIGLSDAYTGDFTNDGKEDVAIYYSIEPTNGGNYLAGQGLALYKNNGKTVSFISTYSPDYLFSFDKISSGNIFISKDEYADEDPRCCPSIHKQIELTINDNKVYERTVD